MASKNANAKVPVALPKGEPTASSLVSQDVSLQMAIGARARITIGTSTIEGTIYTADPITSLVVLNTSPASTNQQISSSTLTAPPGAYRILPISQISSFQLLTLPPSHTSTTTSTTPASTLDPTALQSRLARSLHTATTALSRQGPKGTAPTDQALFDALSRTHPAHWAEGTSTMVISDTFAIDKPYGSANVRFVEAANGVGDIERMRKVVDMEKSKVLLRMGKGDIDGRLSSGAAGGGVGVGVKKGG